jgi:hypothetical protein
MLFPKKKNPTPFIKIMEPKISLTCSSSSASSLIHALTLYLFKVHINIIILSIPGGTASVV